MRQNNIAIAKHCESVPLRSVGRERNRLSVLFSVSLTESVTQAQLFRRIGFSQLASMKIMERRYRLDRGNGVTGSRSSQMARESEVKMEGNHPQKPASLKCRF
jgi:hypothetical protein